MQCAHVHAGEDGPQGEDEWKWGSLECGEDGHALGRNSLRCRLAASSASSLQ